MTSATVTAGSIQILQRMSVRPERERRLLFDPDSPEYIKDLQRPAVIKEDLTEMERRKRVQEVLESKSFLRQLENVIRNESEVVKSEPEHLKLQQRLSELTVPNRALSYNNIHNIGLPPIPIADLNNNENVSKQERHLRNKMAAFCRLIDMFQWVQGFGHNHITYKIPSENEEILINPFGLLFHEMSASSIMKVKGNGDILNAGCTRLGISQMAIDLHSAIRYVRPDAICILQLHTALVAAVASMQCGLLRVCHEAILLGAVSCHDYSGLDEDAEIQGIVKSLENSNVLLLRNRGFIAVGESIEEVFLLAQNLTTACETQLRAVKAGITNLIQTNEEIARKTYNKSRNGGSMIRSPAKESPVHLKPGEVEWEAWMRVLDHQGLRSGHLYKQPQLKPRSQMTQSMYITSDVAVPPSASSVGALDETDHDSIIAHKLALYQKEQKRSRWLNSPNAYQKIEILETNTDCPKTITKWIQDATSQSANGTPVKLSGAHQFSPMSVNPKEFKERQQKIKENRLSGKTSAGPQSVILNVNTHEDLRDIKPDADGIVCQADRSVLIGTASKGIINRTQQHNAQVYRQLYAPNPFSVETDEKIQKYMREVEAKSPKSRTPTSSMRDHLVDTRAETASPEDYPSADVASLMQGIRLHRNTDTSRTSVSMDNLEMGDTSISIAINVDSGRDSTFDSTRACNELDIEHSQPLATSTPKAESDDLKRSRKDKKITSDTSTRTNATFSEDETMQSEGKKKKKKGFFSSLLRKKDRSDA